MDKQEKKYPPGYHRNDNWIEIKIEGRSFALVKRELNREFNQVIFDLHRIDLEMIDGTYYWIIGEKADIEIKTSELIQWFGLACAADGSIKEGGLNPALGANMQQSVGPSIAEQVAKGPSEAPPSSPPDGDDDIPF